MSTFTNRLLFLSCKRAKKAKTFSSFRSSFFPSKGKGTLFGFFQALLYGSLYAVAGVGLISFGIWKLSGASNFQVKIMDLHLKILGTFEIRIFQEFRAKVGGVLPVVPKNSPTQG